MKREKSIFNEGRFRVLRTLYMSINGKGVSLREISRRNGISVHGVQVAVASLLRIRVIKKRGMGQRLYLSLNRSHPDFPVICALVEVQIMQEIKNQALVDSRNNTNLLEAINDLYEFSHKVKASK